MKTFLYLYNPFSGTQAGGNELDLILAAFYKNGIYVHPHRLFSLEEEQDAVLEELLADRERFDGIIISGGDGTVGQIIDRLIRYGNDTPVGIVPGGTCNDFARNLGMPASLFDCIRIFCEQRVRAIDLLEVHAQGRTQYICNSIAAGVFVGVSHTTSPEFKKVFGSLAYYIAALGELSEMHPFHITVKTEDQTVESEALVFAVLNGTDVGGMKNLISEAELTDGKMNIMIVRDCNAVERAGVGINLLARKPDKNILQLSCARATITVDKEMAVSVDGESGPALPYEIVNVPGKLRVFVPESFS